MKSKRHNRAAGFTLLELLVAVGVFAVVAALASSGFNSVLNNATRSEEQMDRLAKLQKAMVILARDVQQAVDRPIRDEFGGNLPAFLGGQPDNLLEFSRTGRRNPAQAPRSHLQRIGFHFEDETFYRLSWAVMDRASDTEPLESKLVEGINEVDIRYLDATGTWHEQWPPLRAPTGGAAALPQGLEITFDIQGLGEVPRLFRVAG